MRPRSRDRENNRKIKLKKEKTMKNVQRKRSEPSGKRKNDEKLFAVLMKSFLNNWSLFARVFFSIDFDLNSNSLFLSYNWQVWIDGGEHLTVGRTINKVMRWRKWRLHEKIKAKIRNGKSIERVIISIENYLFSSLTVPTAAIKIEFLVRFQPRSETEKERKRLC